ncbi:hypothetical protein ANACOL_00641 [Anaerotruncus colihominis DSM 17241]|uniref:Uncharacterized protein n=1 Tax=Anaerotruncus colihominis DSM 17241 TaxID=445972 RepID=B0P7B1_9FIRM|nr:hypothetical protein ANACOL_00641 [Anaerotruncus colihominis DSM 17241]
MQARPKQPPEQAARRVFPFDGRGKKLYNFGVRLHNRKDRSKNGLNPF